MKTLVNLLIIGTMILTSNTSNPYLLYLNISCIMIFGSLLVLNSLKKDILDQSIGLIILGFGLKSIITHLSMDVLGKEKTIEMISSNWVETSPIGWGLISFASVIVIIVVTSKKCLSNLEEINKNKN